MKERGFEILEGYDENATMPQRATSKSAGYDLYSAEDVVIRPGQRVLVETGLTAFMQDDEELQIRPRSGLAFKQGLTVLNSPGTVDADYYPQHVKVLLYNTSDQYIQIHVGDRIAQGIFAKFLTTDNDDPLSNYREGGFGHTGK